MAEKKESYFWTSYSDLMTSLFLVMLVLFVMVIVLLHKRMEATEQQLAEIKKVENSTKDLSQDYFRYRPEYKKYQLRITVQFAKGSSDITDIPLEKREALYNAGLEIQNFLNQHSENQYLIIVEGQASWDYYAYNYELSYNRALALIRYWMVNRQIGFPENSEILIAGSGDGKYPTHSMRETGNEALNQRFLIHIIPKNIFGDGQE